jgi:hypothetical protein
MALPKNRPTNIVVTGAYMVDSGTASSVYLVAPIKGHIKRFVTVLQGTAITGANNTFTTFIGSVAMTTIDAFVQIQSGSAAGDIVTANVTPNSTASTIHPFMVNEGDMIKVTSDGAGSSVTPTMVYAVIEAH